jgi:hypothetical protein
MTDIITFLNGNSAEDSRSANYNGGELYEGGARKICPFVLTPLHLLLKLTLNGYITTALNLFWQVYENVNNGAFLREQRRPIASASLADKTRLFCLGVRSLHLLLAEDTPTDMGHFMLLALVTSEVSLVPGDLRKSPDWTTGISMLHHTVLILLDLSEGYFGEGR